MVRLNKLPNYLTLQSQCNDNMHNAFNTAVCLISYPVMDVCHWDKI